MTYASDTIDTPAVRLHPASGVTSGRLSRLRALVLLSGVVRTKSWIADIGRSVLDLPIDSSRTLLGHWLEHGARLAEVPGVERLSMEVLVDRLSPMPESGRLIKSAAKSGVDDLKVERDPADYRGTGGVLRDLSLRYDENDYLLVATGAQVLFGSLEEVVVTVARRAPDVAIIGHDDRSPAGLMWIRCGCLRSIPEVGFVDLKEQALPQIARTHQVEVVRLPAIGTSHRTPAEYLRAVRQYHLRSRFGERLSNPFVEDWYPTFSIIEEGAEVHPSAQVHDSVVLKGGRVERDAVVVRSLVGPIGLVRRGQRAIDRLVSGPGRSKDETC